MMVDHSDRKATDILINILNSLPSSTKSRCGTTHTPNNKLSQKNRTLSKADSKQTISPIAKRLAKKNVSQSSTLNTWLNKGSKRKTPDKTNHENTSYPQLDVTIAKSSSIPINKEQYPEHESEGKKFQGKRKMSKKTKTNTKSSKVSESCHGLSSNPKKIYNNIVLPTSEEILKKQRELEEYRAQVNYLVALDEKLSKYPLTFLKPNELEEKSVNLLDCKHLLIDDIIKAFNANLKYLTDIFHGRKYSKRHQQFHKNPRPGYIGIGSLCASTSTIVFTFDQIERLIMMLTKEFDPEDKLTDYFFKVLLPELCLKIFMDVHKMTYEEAVNYLEKRPIDD